MSGGICVIGAGMVGAAHAAAYRSYLPRFQRGAASLELHSVVDARREAAEAVAARYGFREATTDWRAAVGDERVGIVSVVLPNAAHEEVVLAALAARKHVLCEKPLALTAAGARRMAAAAASAGVVARTMFNYRRIPAVAETLERVGAGELGTLTDLHIAYRTEYAADPDLPFSWRYDRAAAGGGALVDVGTHAIDLALALCGPVGEVVGALESVVVAERRLPARSVAGHAHGALSEERRAVDTDDVFSALLRFRNGCIGHLFASRVAVGHGNSLAFTLTGTEGTVRFESGRPNTYDLAVRRPGAPAHFQRVHIGSRSPFVSDLLPVPHDGVTVGYAEAFGFAVADFLDAVVNGAAEPSMPFEEGVAAAEVLEAMQASARLGSAVPVGVER